MRARWGCGFSLEPGDGGYRPVSGSPLRLVVVDLSRAGALERDELMQWFAGEVGVSDLLTRIERNGLRARASSASAASYSLQSRFARPHPALPGDPRSVAMRFTFHRPGDATPLCAPTVRDVEVAVGGAFSARVPLDAAGAVCPGDMLDGRDVQVDVDVGALSVVRNAEVNPVPYAHFATSAGTATRAIQGPEVLSTTLAMNYRTPESADGSRFTVPGLSLRLRQAGTYLLILNASFYSSGNGDQGDTNMISLFAADRTIARQALAGRGSEPSLTQRSGSVTLTTLYTAVANTDVTAIIDFGRASGTIELAGGPSNTLTTRILAIPVRVEP